SQPSRLFTPRLVAALLGFTLVCLLAWWWPLSGSDLNLLVKNQAPSWQYWFGTDWLGRDVFSRTLNALKTSLWVGGLAVVLSTSLALVLAMLTLVHASGRYLVDLLVDVMMSLPHLLLMVLLSLAIGGSEQGLIVAVALSHWPKLTRLLIFEMKAIAATPYYQLAQQFGCGQWQVIWRHMLPHILPQVLIGSLLLFPHALVHMAALTFLGFGLDPLYPTLGGLLSQASNYLQSGQWWLGLFPGLVLLLVLLILAYIADCLHHRVRIGGVL
ncbi:MAG: ABC transporter permease, partial [Shewanella sp.]